MESEMRFNSPFLPFHLTIFLDLPEITHVTCFQNLSFGNRSNAAQPSGDIINSHRTAFFAKHVETNTHLHHGCITTNTPCNILHIYHICFFHQTPVRINYIYSDKQEHTYSIACFCFCLSAQLNYIQHLCQYTIVFLCFCEVYFLERLPRLQLLLWTVFFLFSYNVYI